MTFTNSELKCKSCEHQNVCKYQEEYQSIYQDLKNTLSPRLKQASQFTISIDCLYYQGYYGIINTSRTLETGTISIQPEPIPIIYTTDTSNSLNFEDVTCSSTNKDFNITEKLE